MMREKCHEKVPLKPIANEFINQEKVSVFEFERYELGRAGT